MASNLSSKGETAVLAPLTSSAYISLHTGDPGDTGANEVSGGGYQRQNMSTSGGFSNAVVGNTTVASNVGIVSFPTASAGWGTVSYFGIWDSGTTGAGNFRGSGTLASAKNVNLNDTARFLAGTLTITAA